MKLFKSLISLFALGIGGGLIGYYLASENQEPWYQFAMAFLALGLGGALFGATWFSKKKNIIEKEAKGIMAPDYLPFNRWAYAIFVLLAAYQFVYSDPSDAIASFGIALVFDPFNPKTKWSDRPLWQRTWLLLHFLLMAIGFVLMLTDKL
jgi:uncharacterized membrane protein YfcA